MKMLDKIAIAYFTTMGVLCLASGIALVIMAPGQKITPWVFALAASSLLVAYGYYYFRKKQLNKGN